MENCAAGRVTQRERNEVHKRDMIWNVVVGATSRRGLLMIENFLAGGPRRSYEERDRDGLATTKKLTIRRLCTSRLVVGGNPIFLATHTL